MRAGLVKKRVTDKNGKRTSVWVRSGVKPTQGAKVNAIAYHGTPDARKINSLSGGSKGVIWFSDNRKTANSYADVNNAFDYQNAVPKVFTKQVRMNNALVVDAKKQTWRKSEFEIDGEKIVGTRRLVDFAKRKGYDGIVVKNVYDHYSHFKGEANKKSNLATNYAVFNDNQVKGANAGDGKIDVSSFGDTERGLFMRYNEIKNAPKISDYEAALLIAKDRGLFKEIENYKYQNKPLTEDAEKRLVGILSKVKPVGKVFYRGVEREGYDEKHIMRFQSWSENKDTAKMFGDHIRETTVPSRGVRLSDVYYLSGLVSGDSDGLGDTLAEWLILPPDNEGSDFDEWFKGSKVVDSNGKPKIMYHGTNAEFNEFDDKKKRSGWLSEGFYFTHDKSEAHDYGKIVMSVHLSLKNPFVIKADKVKEDGSVEWAKSTKEQIAEAYPEIKNVKWKDWANHLEKKGHDGVINGDSLITVFRANQIRTQK